MIDVEGLVFEYPGVRALDGVGFSLPEHSITALVGPNGAGKSTLMRCIVGLETPLAGRVRIGGLDVQDETRASQRLVGFLSDFYGLYDDLSARRCLLYRAAAMGVAPAERPARVAEVAGRCGLAELLDRPAGALSRGQRQRLAIAQALVHGPRVLLLDEPASGLDPSARARLSALLRQLRDEGLTILVSSHILSELEDYSTRMLAMEQGRVRIDRELGETPARARWTVVLRLAAADERLAAALADFEEVAEVALEERGARFTLPAGAAHCAALLAGLVARGLPVSAFQVEAESMERAYLGLAETD